MVLRCDVPALSAVPFSKLPLPENPDVAARSVQHRHNAMHRGLFAGKRLRPSNSSLKLGCPALADEPPRSIWLAS